MVGTGAANTFDFSMLTSMTGLTSVDGGAGNDTLIGSKFADTLHGGEDNDIITGGLGKDTLFGDAGNDIFDFNIKTETPVGATNMDVIMDFAQGQDHIDLVDIDAKSKTAVVNDVFKFIGSKAFTKHAGELHFVTKAGFLLVEGDTDGNGKADFQIEVHGATALLGTDFVL